MKTNTEYYQIKQLLEHKIDLSMDECFSIFSWLTASIQKEDTEGSARDILLRLLDKADVLPIEARTILNDYIERFGYFPYLQDLDKASVRTLLRYEFYRSEHIPDIVMHQKQAEVYDSLYNKQSVILSAPTSFGKSLLIEEIVASREYNNIVIILPTLALIDETRMKLMKYAKDYKLIFSSKQSFDERNVFILTAERLIEIEQIPNIDFFIIDEFYKLDSSRSEDERLNVLNHAFYKLLKCTDKFYLLGPNIASIPSGFEERYGCKFIPSEYTTVACDEIYIKRKKNKEFDQLVELVQQLREPTMIYCKSPGSAEKYVKKFLDKGKTFLDKNTSHTDSIEWIEKNIHPEWLLIDALRHGIAFHHGSMPRHLGRYIVEEFNKGNIKYLFCTSTLIEGINTTAKNVIVYDNKKGRDLISFFDYRNIRGRAGRMTKHFVGRVFSFYTPPEDIDVDVDFPWFTQDNASDEILIQVEEKDLKDDSIEKLKPYKEQNVLDIEIIKKNNNIPVRGQVELAQLLHENVDYYHKFLGWTSYPTYDQLRVTCELLYKYLRFANTRDEVYSGKQLALYVNKYVRFKSNMARFIDFFVTSDKDNVDKAVQKATKISRNWFEFRFPKLLLGLQEIQESVFKQHGKTCGDYRFYASTIEAAFCTPALSALQEFGLPISLLRKLEPYLNLKEIEKEEDLDKVIAQIRSLHINEIELDAFELKLLKDFLRN